MGRHTEIKAAKAKRRDFFVNTIIIVCLAVCLYITINATLEYRRLDMPMDSGVLAVLLGIWGGELLLIVVRQVLGSDIRRKNPYESEEQTHNPNNVG